MTPALLGGGSSTLKKKNEDEEKAKKKKLKGTKGEGENKWKRGKKPENGDAGSSVNAEVSGVDLLNRLPGGSMSKSME